MTTMATFYRSVSLNPTVKTVLQAAITNVEETRYYPIENKRLRYRMGRLPKLQPLSGEINR
jgi:hypothetical protein